MSRNNKNARLNKEKKAWSTARKNGNPGPSSTQSKHGKRFSYRNPPPAVAKARAEAIAKIMGKARDGKTVLEKLKEKGPTVVLDDEPELQEAA